MEKHPPLDSGVDALIDPGQQLRHFAGSLGRSRMLPRLGSAKAHLGCAEPQRRGPPIPVKDCDGAAPEVGQPLCRSPLRNSCHGREVCSNVPDWRVKGRPFWLTLERVDG